MYQLIEIWETFLMQLDTEEGENFVPPAGVIATVTTEPSAAAEEVQSEPQARVDDEP
jgi:sorting nexin-1/2